MVISNFNDFVRFWDEFVDAWYFWLNNNGTMPPKMDVDIDKLLKYYKQYFPKDKNGIFDLNISHIFKSALESNELPEPYLMHFDMNKGIGKIKFIMINLNPGGTANNVNTNIYVDDDGTKMLDFSKMRKGGLLSVFDTNYNRSYSNYINDYSCLAGNKAVNSTNPPQYVCGYNWWNGKSPSFNGGRMTWIREFSKLLYNTNNPISADQVLALELCPFHSKSWNSDILLKMPATIADIIKRAIYIPALQIADQNNIPVIACIGKDHCSIIEYLFWGEVDKVSVSVDNRHYILYKVNTQDTNGNKLVGKILVTYAPGSNKPPKSTYSKLESAIIKL